MNSKIQTILNALQETPRILKELIDEIEPKLYKKEIISGRWNIHEHATHVAVGDLYGFQKRLSEFKKLEHPIFEPLSGDNFSKEFFLDLDLEQTLNEFIKVRQETIQLANSFDVDEWHKEATHPEYKRYTPYIMLHHLLMHDHAHLYKIEDMGFGIGHIK
jgi:hypothetical protein